VQAPDEQTINRAGVWMADMPAGTRPTRARRLSKANTEPGGRAIFGAVILLNAVLRPLTRRDWRGQEKLPRTGGVVVVANHISNADPLALGQFLAYSGRWPRFLAKASIFKIPILGGILRACGQLPVERNSTRSGEGLAAAIAAVGEGRAVVIYPEGTISKDPDLWPMAGRTGAARVALRTGCPVIPVGQWGAQELLYGDQLGFPKILPRKTLRLIVGDPVLLDDLRRLPLTAAVLGEATTRMMDALTALVAELRGAEPPAERYDPRAQRTEDTR
jgi:1-acyl-sn-glycerol-3-phosphate acyltransferase